MHLNLSAIHRKEVPHVTAGTGILRRKRLFTKKRVQLVEIKTPRHHSSRDLAQEADKSRSKIRHHTQTYKKLSLACSRMYALENLVSHFDLEKILTPKQMSRFLREKEPDVAVNSPKGPAVL